MPRRMSRGGFATNRGFAKPERSLGSQPIDRGEKLVAVVGIAPEQTRGSIRHASDRERTFTVSPNESAAVRPLEKSESAFKRMVYKRVEGGQMAFSAQTGAVPKGMGGVMLAAVASLIVASSHVVSASARLAGQNRDQDAAKTMADASEEVVRTASTHANRFETEHLILHIDKGLLAAEAEREFSSNLERHFVATSEYLQRPFDRVSRKTAKPAYYLTNRAGISHAEATRVFLHAGRVIASPAIAIHETVHLLLFTDPEAPRTRSDLTPEEDARLMATTGVWLAEGFAGYAAFELAARLGIEPDRLFVKGDRTTVDEEARQWTRDARGAKVLPFVGSRGIPDGLLSDRLNVAPPFYVLSQSFSKYLVEHAGLAVIVRLHEEHFAGTRSIEDDVRGTTGKDLVEWRQEWVRALR